MSLVFGSVRPLPSGYAQSTYFRVGWVSGTNKLTYYLQPTVASTIQGNDSSGVPQSFTPAQIASQLSTFFDASGLAAGVLATANVYATAQAATAQAAAISAAAANTTSAINSLIGSAPSILSTLAAIDTQLASDETAASVLTNAVGGKMAQPNGTTAQYVTGNGTLETFSASALSAVTWSTIIGKPMIATVAISGSYNDLSNQPPIPSAQVNSDWNATTGAAKILNKPTLGTAAAQDTSAFDSAGTAATAVAALVSTAPSTLATLAAIDAQMASDESAAAALVAIVSGKLPSNDSRLPIHAFSANLGTTARRSGKIFLSGLSGLSSHISAAAWQSSVPGTGKGVRTDNSELEQIRLRAVIVNDASMRLYWMANGPVLGNFNFFYQFKN